MRAFENTACVMLAGFIGLSMSACAESEADEQLGQVELTLQASDGQGNTWKLPADTFMHVQRGAFADTLLLDGNVPVKSFALPAGNFSWHIYNLNGYGPTWPLQRVDPQNNVDIVMATLANPQPDTFVIVPSSTTSLTLQFNAAVGGSITFAKGTVDVDMDVTTSEATGADVQWSATLQSAEVSLYPSAPPVLATRLPADGDSGSLNISASLAGPWDMISLTSVCAPVAVQALSASGATGLADLTSESIPNDGLGQLCLSSSGDVSLAFLRFGAPTTSTFNDLGAPTLGFSTSLAGQLPVPAFDGDTLDLSLVSGQFMSNMSTYQSVSAGSATWYDAIYTGQMNFSFVPTL